MLKNCRSVSLTIDGSSDINHNPQLNIVAIAKSKSFFIKKINLGFVFGNELHDLKR